MNTKILEEIGLTDSEIKVYLALLELGSSKKGPIVKKAGITSSKIYEVIDKLIERGLASYVVKDKVKYFNAAPPSRIKDYLKEKENQIKKQETELDKLLPSLELKQKLTEKETDAEVYRGWRGMQTVYNDLVESLKSKDEFYIFGASRGTDTKKVKSFYTRFNNRVKQKKLKANIIFNENARGNVPNVKEIGKVKYLDQTTPSEILIYKNKTAVVLLEKEPLIILIRGESIAKSFKAYFDVMWIVAKK
jgi:HTH-type transcriptional regulator, sugar sensing transcriptional regulator